MDYFQTLFTKRYLVLQYLNRQIRQRYRGSMLGVFWSLLTPLAMLVVYSFVFGTIFHSRFDVSQRENPVDFGLALFCGLNLFNFCSEVISNSPTLILDHSNLVKKVVFPLETLPAVTALDALLHCVIAFVPLFLAMIIFDHAFPWSFVFLPLFLLPLAFFAVGCSLLLSALGVFIRDIKSLMVPLLTILMFCSAVFYPLTAIPQPYRQVIQLNPLARLIENARNTIIGGAAPSLIELLILTVAALLFVFLSSALFAKAKPAFADVL
jgi:lipopolysaccharide transport system permease protein